MGSTAPCALLKALQLQVVRQWVLHMLNPIYFEVYN